MNEIEGRLDIDWHPDAALEIDSTRPVHACRVMIGKQPQEMLALLPLMFSVCGVAQSRAALRATEDALGIGARSGHEAARDLLVQVECAREDLLRIFVDWPQLFGFTADQGKLRSAGELNRSFAAALFRDGRAFALDSELDLDEAGLGRAIDDLEHYLERHVFDTAPVTWMKMQSYAELEDWAGNGAGPAAAAIAAIIGQDWAGLARAECPQLPALDPDELRRCLDSAGADEFIARPQWQGQCHETTVLSRELQNPLIQALDECFGRALITRWCARLVELASIPARLRGLAANLTVDSNPSQAPADGGDGLAQIEAARGRLVHRVRIDAGAIAGYQILAPTEWNFHPQGLIRKAIEAIEDCPAEQRERLARIVISAIDPCVGYRLRVH